MEAKGTAGARAAAGNAAEAGNSVENTQAADNTPKEGKGRGTANTDGTGETYIYIGPTTNGLVENTIIKGTKEGAEGYLKDVIEKVPQVKMLIVPTETLAANKAKAKKAGTLLNKYYNDVLSLSRKGV